MQGTCCQIKENFIVERKQSRPESIYLQAMWLNSDGSSN